ncbi:hypothetical protein ACTHO0_21280 [Cytobacillus praedii]|uniref:hypothetical protein n=1 Tax=Cytobacillus praedii TaxID=1742358 RepID=UPI003F7E9D95
MDLKHFLAIKFPRCFEDKRITHLKRLGVNFNEDVPGNFIPHKKDRVIKAVRKSNNIEQIVNQTNN